MALIFSITVTGILANALVNAPLPDILAAFSEPDSRAGLVVASGTLPGIVMAPVIGLMADRYGRRAVLVPCLVSFGVFGVAAGLAPSFGFLLLCRLGQGFGSAGLINLAVVLIGDTWEGTERARRIGWNAAVLTISIAVLPALGGVLAQVGGWRWSFAPYTLALVTAGAAWGLLAGGGGGAGLGLGAQLRDAGAVLRRPLVFSSIAFGFLLFVLIFGLFLTTMPILVEEDFGLGPAARGLVLSVPALGSTAAALSLGRLRERASSHALLVVACLLFAAGFAVIGLAPTLVVLGVGCLVYGLGEGMAIPTIQDVVSGAAPTASRGAVVAVWVGAARAGQTLGPLLAGVGLGSIGPGPTFVVGAGLSLVLLAWQALGPAARHRVEPAPAA
jgi:MFS family permease